jgi:hypothetical protein
MRVGGFLVCGPGLVSPSWQHGHMFDQVEKPAAVPGDARAAAVARLASIEKDFPPICPEGGSAERGVWLLGCTGRRACTVRLRRAAATNRAQFIGPTILAVLLVRPRRRCWTSPSRVDCLVTICWTVWPGGSG